MNWQKWQQFIKKYGLEPKKNRKSVGMIFFGLSIFIFFIFVIRLIYVVGVGEIGGESLDEKTKNLYQGSSVIQAKRGAIYDRNGYPIAEDATSYSLYAVLYDKYLGLADAKTGEAEKLYLQDKDKGKVARILAKELSKAEESKILDAFNPELDKDGFYPYQVTIGKAGTGLTLATKSKIEKALEKEGIKGIYFEDKPARNYPNGVFSTHLIGYTKVRDDGSLKGEMGIEEGYNEELSGTNGLVEYVKGYNQQKIPGKEIVKKEAKDGIDIYTTLDTALQSYLEDLLDEAFETYTPQDITVMMAEAKTGNIIAAGQRGTFNPMTLEGLADRDPEDAEWNNLLVGLPFEPGSTMKVFTMAAALETGAYDPNAKIVTGSIKVVDRKISDWLPEGIGSLTYREAFAWSSNKAMVTLEQKMGDKWFDYLNRFGFGKVIDLQLPHQLPGFISRANVVDEAMTSYGQAISITPFQMIQAMTAITNEGKMLKPNFVSKIVYPDGTEEKVAPEVVGEPISASTAKEVLSMMVDVVESEHGTGHAFQLENHSIGAKTGTAQISESTGYATDGYINSVVEVVPADDPEYIIYVTMRRPNERIGSTASEIISNITSPLIVRAMNVESPNEETDDQEE